MKCERARELFSDYLEGNIEDALTISLRGHLDECPDCRDEFEGFKQTWGLLGSLPEVDPPVNLRHDLVMRLVRAQHEEQMRSRQTTFGSAWAQMFTRLVPARAIAIACAGAALAAMFINLPNLVRETGSSINAPETARLEQLTQSNRQAEAQLLTAYETTIKERWRNRPLQSNTLWVSVATLEQGEQRAVYRITLSINPNAVIEGATARLATKVYLLPERPDHLVSLDDETMQKAQLMWEGNVVLDQPAALHWPVYYTSRGPGASKLLVTWTFRKRDFAKIIYIPTRRPGEGSTASSEFSPGDWFSTIGGDLYTMLDRVSQDFGVVIIANAQLHSESPTILLTATSDIQSEDDALHKLLPEKVVYRRFDNAIYVDRRLGHNFD